MKPNIQGMSWNRKITLSLLLLLTFGIFGIATLPPQGIKPPVEEDEPIIQVVVSPVGVASDQLPTEGLKEDQQRGIAASIQSDELEGSIEESPVEIPAWRTTLDDLIAVGHSGEDPSAAILALLSAEPGMGDRLLALILELDGSQNEQDALLVALATALTLDPDHVGGGSWPEGLESLWHDRAGTILWMAELWIEGHPKAHYFQRFLQMENVLEPWHSVELAALLENGPVKLDENGRLRLQQLLEHSLLDLGTDALVIAREWVQSENSTLRGVALRTVGRSLASDPVAAREWVESVRAEDSIPVLESVLGQVEGDQLVELIDETADWMLRQEYRGSALLKSFSRGTELDLEEVVYLRGDTPESESYRNLMLYASQGGIGRGDQIPQLWAKGLKRIAQTDPALSVRCMALRVCAMTWPSGDQEGFAQLIRRSDVDPRTAEIAYALMVARESTR